MNYMKKSFTVKKLQAIDEITGKCKNLENQMTILQMKFEHIELINKVQIQQIKQNVTDNGSVEVTEPQTGNFLKRTEEGFDKAEPKT